MKWAENFAKFVACCGICKFEKLLPLVITGGDDATAVQVVFVVAVVIWPNPFVGTVVTIFCIPSRDWIKASISGCEPKNKKMRHLTVI